MSEAWRTGVPFGAALFALALLATVPYFIVALPDASLADVSDAVSVIAVLVLLEVGRRAGRRAGVGAGALAGGIAGFVASLASILQHALLTAAPGYARFVADHVGRAHYAQMVAMGSGAAAMAGIFAAVVSLALLGAGLGLLGGLVGAYVLRGRGGTAPTG